MRDWGIFSAFLTKIRGRSGDSVLKIVALEIST